LKARKNNVQVYNDLSNIYRKVFEVLKQFLYCVEHFCIVLSDRYQHLCTGPYVKTEANLKTSKTKNLTPGKIWTNQRSNFFKQLYNGGYHRIATAFVWATLDSWRFLEVSFIHSRRRFLAPL